MLAGDSGCEGSRRLAGHPQGGRSRIVNSRIAASVVAMGLLTVVSLAIPGVQDAVALPQPKAAQPSDAADRSTRGGTVDLPGVPENMIVVGTVTSFSRSIKAGSTYINGVSVTASRGRGDIDSGLFFARSSSEGELTFRQQGGRQHITVGSYGTLAPDAVNLLSKPIVNDLTEYRSGDVVRVDYPDSRAFKGKKGILQIRLGRADVQTAFSVYACDESSTNKEVIYSNPSEPEIQTVLVNLGSNSEICFLGLANISGGVQFRLLGTGRWTPDAQQQVMGPRRATAGQEITVRTTPNRLAFVAVDVTSRQGGVGVQGYTAQRGPSAMEMMSLNRGESEIAYGLIYTGTDGRVTFKADGPVTYKRIMVVDLLNGSEAGTRLASNQQKQLFDSNNGVTVDSMVSSIYAITDGQVMVRCEQVGPYSKNFYVAIGALWENRLMRSGGRITADFSNPISGFGDSYDFDDTARPIFEDGVPMIEGGMTDEREPGNRFFGSLVLSVVGRGSSGGTTPAGHQTFLTVDARC